MVNIQVAIKALGEIHRYSDLDIQIQSYSGRGMYGRVCLGVVLSSIDEVFRLGQELYELEFPKLRSDNMGMDMIVYWPDLELTEKDIQEIHEIMGEE